MAKNKPWLDEEDDDCMWLLEMHQALEEAEGDATARAILSVGLLLAATLRDLHREVRHD